VVKTTSPTPFFAILQGKHFSMAQQRRAASIAATQQIPRLVYLVIFFISLLYSYIPIDTPDCR